MVRLSLSPLDTAEQAQQRHGDNELFLNHNVFLSIVKFRQLFGTTGTAPRVHSRRVATRAVTQGAAGTACGNFFRQLAWRIL
jgi:hypothetical protein